MPLLIAISLTLLVGYRRMVEESHAPSLLVAQRVSIGLGSIVSWRLVVWVSIYCFSYGLVSSFMHFSKLSLFDNFGNMIPAPPSRDSPLDCQVVSIMRALKNHSFLYLW